MATESRAVNSSVRASGRSSKISGRPWGGSHSRRSRRLQAARMRPAAPPRRPSSRLSVRSWRTRRRRPAPRASRIPISRARAAERANTSIATLAQAMPSTTATLETRCAIAPIAVRRMLPRPPAAPSSVRRRCSHSPCARLSGASVSATACWYAASRAAPAWSRETPGCRRATICSQRRPGSSSAGRSKSGWVEIGSVTSLGYPESMP